VRGNERGWARLKRARQILDEIGLGGERLGIFFMSGSQAHTFALAAHTMTERIRKLGPNPLRQATAASIEAEPAPQAYEEEEGFRGRNI
jgi:coenzyme F420-reducing hydrogenase delta subunit